MLIGLLEVENSRSFLQFIVSSFKLCDKTYASGFSDPGLPLDKATNF